MDKPRKNRLKPSLPSWNLIYTTVANLPPEEKAGLNEALHTIVHTAQFEFIEAFLEEFNKELNADTATMVSKLTTVFKKF